MSDPKVYAKIFFDGVLSVNSGSGLQFEDGLKFLRTKPETEFTKEMIAEYLRLVEELGEDYFEI